MSDTSGQRVLFALADGIRNAVAPTAPLAVKMGFPSLSLAFRLGPVGGCHQVETLKYRSLIFILFRVQRSVDPGSSSTAGGRIEAGKNHFQNSHFFFPP